MITGTRLFVTTSDLAQLTVQQVLPFGRLQYRERACRNEGASGPQATCNRGLRRLLMSCLGREPICGRLSKCKRFLKKIGT